MSVPNLKLPGGQQIPQIGLGLWQIKDPKEFKTAFETGIKVGYRHFDSAQAYGNEHLLGDAWQKSGLKRDELFITTKIAVQNFGSNKPGQTFKESLEKLKTDYVDLLLLHFPVPLLRKATWQVVEGIQAEGGARAIGVSNYTIRHLEEMKDYAKVMPAVNQVELHVFLQQPELVRYCQEHNIVMEAYSPLAHARAMDNPIIVQIAQKHKKTYAQIMLRWCVEKGWVVLPKSVTPSRIKENFEIFDFKLTDEDMELIEGQDQQLRTAWSPVHVP